MSDAIADLGPTMRVRLAFFDGGKLLCHGWIIIDREERQTTISSEARHEFRISYKYEEPACPILIHCLVDGELVSRSAMRMGVHTSEDWEAVSLMEPYELCFQCEADFS